MTGYLPRITEVRVLHDRVVHLTFDDGLEGDVDLAPKLWGPVFEQVATDDHAFAEVTVDEETIVWPGDLDLAPEPLYDEVLAATGGSSGTPHR